MGYRAGTRHAFSRGFRNKGVLPLNTYLKTYRIGDYVDIKANSAIQKGMPHKTYHGRTGIVYNVTRRALGVEVNKQVRAAGYHIVASRAGENELPALKVQAAPETRAFLHLFPRLQVRGRVIRKRVNVRVEHVSASTCRIDFLKRVKRNEDVKRAAKVAGKKVPIGQIKRFPVAPKAGYIVPAESAHGLPTIIGPSAYDEMIG